MTDVIATDEGRLPRTLYHYCAASAFLGIIETKCIWLSSLFFMNDSMEYYWFRNRVLKYIKEKEHESPDAYPALEERLLMSSIDLYCACLSKEGDSLSQWRAYADDGRGYAIGFNPRYFIAARLANPELPELVEVVYEEEKQSELVSECLKNLVGKDNHTLGLGLSMLHSNWIILKNGSMCKNPAFKEEKEWRLRYFHFDNQGKLGPKLFRVSNNWIVPYFGYSFADPARYY